VTAGDADLEEGAFTGGNGDPVTFPEATGAGVDSTCCKLFNHDASEGAESPNLTRILTH
jgi:hypothetical protein